MQKLHRVLIVFLLACAALVTPCVSQDDWALTERDPIKTELVLQLVVTCSNPEKIGPVEDSKDGKRSEIWPIIAGRFVGKGIRGSVAPRWRRGG